MRVLITLAALVLSVAVAAASEVELISRTITVSAVASGEGRRSIETAYFRAVSRNGTGPRTESQAMYVDGKPSPITLSYYEADPTTKKWVIQAYNVDERGGPNFSIDYAIDVSVEDNIVFVVTHKN